MGVLIHLGSVGTDIDLKTPQPPLMSLRATGKERNSHAAVSRQLRMDTLSIAFQATHGVDKGGVES